MIYATAPDGTVVKRRTEHDYSWAVLAREQGVWKIKSCSRSKDAAQAKFWRLARYYAAGDVQLVPCSSTKPEPVAPVAIEPETVEELAESLGIELPKPETSIVVEQYDGITGGWYDRGEARTVEAARQLIASKRGDYNSIGEPERWRIVTTTVEEIA